MNEFSHDALHGLAEVGSQFGSKLSDKQRFDILVTYGVKVVLHQSLERSIVVSFFLPDVAKEDAD